MSSQRGVNPTKQPWVVSLKFFRGHLLIPSKPFSLFRKADVRLAPVNVHFRDK